MKTYAKVDSGVVTEVVTPTLDLNGEQYPLEACYPTEFVLQCVDITDHSPRPEQRWTYDGNSFIPEAQPVVDVVGNNEAKKVVLLNEASLSMTPLLLALQLGDATEKETADAMAWRHYSLALQSLDVTQENPVWPVAPQ